MAETIAEERLAAPGSMRLSGGASSHLGMPRKLVKEAQQPMCRPNLPSALILAHAPGRRITNLGVRQTGRTGTRAVCALNGPIERGG